MMIFSEIERGKCRVRKAKKLRHTRVINTKCPIAQEYFRILVYTPFFIFFSDIYFKFSMISLNFKFYCEPFSRVFSKKTKKKRKIKE